MSDFEEFQVTIPSDTAEGRAVQERIIGLLEAREYSMRDVFGVRLALEEALVNAIKHGNQMADDKVVKIECSVSTKHVRVVIEDEGEGFDISAVPDPTEDENLEKPGGRGIMLMRSFMTHVEYNDRGNILILEKRTDEPEEDDD
ncbi:MAG: anti-sigma regulatory factor [Planctomycetaceae bacterium]|nr:anti-sigma regulatory factor [Planctomycetaceae bacterium]